MYKKLLPLLFVSVFSGAHAENNTQAVLDQVFQTYGGRTLISQDKTMLQTGVTHSNARNTDGKLTRSYKYPNKMRIEIAYPEQPEVRVLNGEQAMNNGKPATPPFRAAARLQAARLNLARLLLDHADKVKQLAGDKPNTVILQIDLADDLQVQATVDTATGRITHSEGKGSFNGMPLQFATDYEDFRKVDGHLVAFHEKHYAMGNLIGSSELSSVVFNKDISDSTFE